MDICEGYKCEYPFVQGIDNNILASYINAYFWICGVGVCSIATVGILGSIFSIAAFTSKHLTNTFHMFLVILAFFDLCFSLLILLSSILQIYDIKFQGTTFLDPNWTPNKAWINLYPYFIHPFKYTFLTASEIFTVIISVDRYISIKYPFRYHSCCNTKKFQAGFLDIRQFKVRVGDRKVTTSLVDWKRVSIYSLSAFLFSLCYCIPRFFEFETVHKDKTFKLNVSEIYGKVYGFIYYVVLESIFRCFIPVAVLLYTSVRIYRIARKQRGGRTNYKDDTGSNRRAQNVMLFGIVVLMMITHSCLFGCNMYAIACYELYGAEYIECCGVNLNQEISFLVLQVLWTINSSANCFIYLAASEKFRDVARNTLHFWKLNPCNISGTICNQKT